MNTCQIMLPNSMQCNNPVYATDNGVDYCRLHFSFHVAKQADRLFNPRAVDEQDQPDVDRMLRQREVAAEIPKLEEEQSAAAAEKAKIASLQS